MDDVEEFFTHQGVVVSVSMLPTPREGQGQAAFVEFATREDATAAALVCDKLKLDAPYEDYTLLCSIKHELAKAWQEKRSVYITGLPLHFDESSTREIAEPYGSVFDVRMLPPSKGSVSCFVVMGVADEAAHLIDALHGQRVEG